MSIVVNGSALLSDASMISLGNIPAVVNSLANFLKSKAWDTKVLRKIHSVLVLKQLGSVCYVALDFTALVKRGKEFEGIASVYDGRDGKIKNGYNLLLALGIGRESNERFILDFF